MSAKKKNPLKDLSAFLAHQEETVKVPQPKKLAEAEAFLEKRPTQIADVSRPAKITVAAEANSETIKKLLIEFSEKNKSDFREELYDIIKEVIGKLDHSTSEDKMLINTVLYLSDQENWKESVKTYWENR
ncbi:MAG: hypothetical protein OEX22_02425 [Cyclobacteriaceae bacterium]|nr:hypothetical protein [Cyclobacteriaceae bacterium]